jgi:DNA-binding transcriptional LysR family regulator
MDWGDLKFFFEFAQRGSLSAAAQNLGVDHSTVARRIEALEQHLGVNLVDRLPRAYHLTAVGERILDLTRQVEAGILDIERFARGTDLSPKGVVRLSGPPAITSHFFAPRMLTLRQRYPDLQVELIGEPRQTSLSRREADLALRLFNPREKDFVARHIATVGYGLYGSVAYLAGRERDAWDYLGYDESLDHVPQQRWLKTLAGDKALALRTNDLTTLLMAVRAGGGVAALPHILAYEDASLQAVATDAPPPARSLWLLFHRDLGRSPRVRAVIDHLVAITAEARAAFGGEPRPVSAQEDGATTASD